MDETKVTRIKDIYEGKPDARDEADVDSDLFLQAYVMPPNFNMDALIRGEKFLISGYKGTGKTALMLYLDGRIRESDPASCTSFVLFKSDFDNRKRDQWAKTMVVEREGFLTQPDFSPMWRWHLFQQMVEDNENYNGRIFVQDAAWERFSKLINDMVPKKNRPKRGGARGKLSFGLPLLGGLVEPHLDFTFTADNGEVVHRNFYDMTDEATDAFCDLTRTDVPYYIFLDELEAFYGDSEIFQRDLRLIRDLILEAKAVNMLLLRLRMKNTKIICAVRSEIINSITRFIESKEMNKVVDGFDCPLIWDYNTTASFKHPIMEILLKRIELSEKKNGVVYASREELQRKWFPEHIAYSDPVEYILNSNWSKPRDIVRLISAAHDSLHYGDTAFTQAVMESSMPSYSRKSLTELREELKALYSEQEIDDIFNCFVGFADTFTLAQLEKQVQSYYPHSVLATRTLDVLSDLYRLGVIGNLNPNARRYRWQHRGDDRIILTDDWMITIHRGLRKALSTVGSKMVSEPKRESTGFGQSANPALVGKEVVLTEITTSPNGGIKGRFDGNIGTISRRRLNGIPASAFVGGTLRVRVLGLNPLGGSYELEPVDGLQNADGSGAYTVPTPENGLLCELKVMGTTQNGGIRGTFGEHEWKGTVSKIRLEENGLLTLKPGDLLPVRVEGKNPKGGSYALVPAGEPKILEENIDAGPAPEIGLLCELKITGSTISGGVRGEFGEYGWAGTISRVRLEENGTPNLKAGDILPVRVYSKNPLGDSYALLPAGEPKKAAPAADEGPAPETGVLYEMNVTGIGHKGGIRGTFGEHEWKGTISKIRLEESGVSELNPGDVLSVRVDGKNPLGDSYALIPVKE